jgi:putative ABC transport system permease protein
MSFTSWIAEFRHDLRFAWRAAWKHPGYSLAAILTLACGIGAVTTMLSVVNGVLLRPLPYPNAGRAVLLWTTGRPGTPGPTGTLPLSGPNFLDLAGGARTLERAAAFRSWPVTFAGSDHTELLAGAKVSAGLFEVLGVQPVLGRPFTAEDDVPGAEPVVVLGHGLWMERFGGEPSVLGRVVTLDDARYTVVGVMPAGFAFPRGSELPSGFRFAPRTELWIPLALERGEPILRGLQNLAAIALPRPGVTLDQVGADLDLVMARVEAEYPGFNTNMTVRPAGLLDGPVGRVGTALYVLLGAVGMLLLLACANVSNLLLTRSVARRREVAIRGALGAGRGRMMRQFIAENLLLAGIGAAAGIGLAFALKGSVLALAPAGLPRLDDIALDWRVFGMVLGLMLLIGLGLGALSAAHLTAAGGIEELREGARTGGGRAARRFRQGLTTLEVALSVMLLVGAVTLGRTFLALRQVEPGLEPDRVLTARVVQPFKPASFDDFWSTIPLWAGFQRNLLERVRTIPGVREAAVVTALPLSGAEESIGFSIEGRPEPTPERPVSALFAGVSPGYFAAMGIPLLRGRDFSPADPDSAPGVVISRSLAQAYWPGEDPLGSRLRVFGGQRLEVIGIAGDVRQRGLASEPDRLLYLPTSAYTAPAVTLVVSTSGDPLGVLPAVEHELRRLDRGTALTDAAAMQDIVAESLAQQRFNAVLLGVFSSAALALAVLGLYGVISFGVARRAREFGVRLALGARPAGVQRMVLREGLGLALGGVAAGIVGAAALSRVVSRLVYGAATTDPVTLLSVALLLTAVTILATLVPARRAMRVDPAVVLREE